MSLKNPSQSGSNQIVLPPSTAPKGVKLFYSYLIAGGEKALTRIGDVILPSSVAESKALKILYSFTGLTLPGYKVAGKIDVEQNPKDLPSMVYNTRLPRDLEEEELEANKDPGRQSKF